MICGNFYFINVNKPLSSLFQKLGQWVMEIFAITRTAYITHEWALHSAEKLNRKKYIFIKTELRYLASGRNDILIAQ